MILAGLGEHFGRIDAALNPDLEDIKGSYLDAGHIFVVLENQGELVGTGALLLKSNTIGQIVRVSVRRDCRGQGLGIAIVEHLVGLGRRRNLSKLLVETNHDWLAAISLYKRCGFVEFNRDEESIYLERLL